MKRNLLLLTVIVLAAMLLSGCLEGLFGKVAIKWDVPADTFVKADLVKSAKKDTVFEAKVHFVEDYERVALKWTVTVGKEEAKELIVDDLLDDDDEVIGVIVSYPIEKDKVTFKAEAVNLE